jgi:hypothetical protein
VIEYGLMSGTGSNGMMLFAWLTYILVVVILGLGIAALWKYIRSK